MKLCPLFVGFAFTLTLAVGVLAQGQEKTILAKNPPSWTPAETKVAPEDVVIWKVQNGSHGVMIKNYDAVKDFFTVEPGSLDIDVRQGAPETDKGTPTRNVPQTVLLKVKIKPLATGITSKTIDFYCSNPGHGEMMAGKLVIEASAPAGTASNQK